MVHGLNGDKKWGRVGKMVITNDGKEFIAIRAGSNISAPSHVAIGTGSSTKNASTHVLTTEADRNAFTSTDYSTAKKLTYIANFNSVEMSGLGLKEFGVFSDGTASTGSTWSVEGFQNVVFDGTNELEVEVSWEIF